ncbi:hypothetical protein D6C78_04201 [Aureobasidium pullulans]|uniref:Major facilitator superfamily (MFS) profile domain-containing protein n=1 Tax=Aureobasidium pullulans TaxID=5580 RepID=A0A4T0C1M1_AURPU|nr:hypothetical protein D6C78_04201 [Aureobasidium pullulans]
MATGGVLSSTEVSLIAAVPITGVFLGLPLAAGLGDYTGRRNALFIACIISAVASAIQTAASNLATLVVGRVIAAAAIYMFIVLASTYMAELAPAEIRGILVGLTIVLIDAASILAAGLNWAFSKTMTNLAWRIPVGIQIIFPLIIAAGIFTLDAAPTEYLVKSQDEAALRSLRRIRKGYTDVEIDAEFDSLRAQSSLRSEETAAPILDMFKGTNLRRSFLACSIGVFQQLSGITFATTYATVFLSQASAGINPYLLTLGLSILATGGAIVGLFLVDSVGRRTLALSVFCVIFVIDLVIGVLGFFNDSPASAKAIAAFSLMFAFFFAAGFGPLTYVAASELPTARLKNRTSAFAFGCIAIMNVVVTFVIPYISQPDG